MQRVNLLIRIRQALLSMFLASVAALLISTAPAYAAEADASVDELSADNATLVDAGTAVTASAGEIVDANANTGVEPAADEPGAAVVAEEAAAEALTQIAADETQVAVEPQDNVYSITQSGEYTLSGQGTTSVSISGTIDVILNLVNAEIDATGTGNSAISVTDGAKALLNIIGANRLVGDANQAGIQVGKDSQLAIEGADEPSSLTAIGNAGVDYSSAAEYNASAKTNGAGIGGTNASPDSGVIAINGHDRNLTVSAIGGGRGASGIGSSNEGAAGAITVVGTNLVGVHGGCNGAPVEGQTEYAKSTLEGGSAIGGGTKGTAGGGIVIDNCYGRDIVGGGKSAGIGGGCWATTTAVSISNSDLEVEGGTSGAAIGTGRVTGSTDLSVSIVDSAIVARGGTYGAGIGTGINGSNYTLQPASVVISGSSVVATGGAGAAGIGAGVRGYNVSVAIDGGSNVVAYAGANYYTGYTELHNGAPDTVTETGTTGQSGAAAIGRGAWGSVKFTDKGEAASLSISADSTVLAMSSGDNWAIAGFADVDGVNASVLEMRFSRNYDQTMKNSTMLLDFITRTVDEENLSREVCFLDGVRQTILKVRDAETGEILYLIDTTQLDESFASGYAGDGRVGYYSFALTVADGAYKVSTTSDLRSLTRLGDVLLSEGDEGYLGGATHLNEDEADRQALFVVGSGINAYDRVAFRVVADPEPAPDPDPTPDPDPDPEPGPAPSPGPDPTPDPEPAPDPDPESAPAPVPDSDPVPPVVDPDSDPAPEPAPDPEPAADPEPAPADDTPAPVAEPILDAPAPAAPAPAAAPAAPVAPAAPAAPAPVAIEVIADDAVPLAAAAVEVIADDANPLAVFDPDHDEDCWVHWWILLGMVLTTIYSSVVIARRKRHSSNLKGMDDDVMDGTIGENDAASPAPSVNLGTQPAMSASEK